MTNITKIQELERLKKLKDDGVLSDEEFAKIKQEIFYGNDISSNQGTPKEPEILLVDQPEPETLPINLPEPEMLSVSPSEQETQATEQPVSPIVTETVKTPPSHNPLLNKQSTQSEGKKINSTLLGFGIAVAVVVFLFIIFLVFSSRKSDKKSDYLTPATISEEQITSTNKTMLVDDITGIWSSGSETFTIISTDSKFQLWIDKIQIDAKLGNTDTEQEIINLLSKSPTDGKEIISPLKRKWNSDHTASTLTLTLENGQIINLNFVRKLSSDDLSRFAKLAKEQNNKLESFDKIYGKNKASEEITTSEAQEFAEQYAKEAMAATNSEDLKQHYYTTVKYFNRGELPLDDVMTDKKRYYKKWPTLLNKLI